MQVSQNTERMKLKEDLVAKGVSLHDKARRGDPHATREAYELFKVAHQLDPDDASVRAYYGSALSLQGRDAVDPNEKVQKALRGLKLLDQAAQDDPDNITVRTLRAYVNYRVPEHFFNRTSVAVQDFTYLVKRYEDDPTVLARGSYWEILYHLGKAYQTLGEEDQARATWEKLIAAKPSQKYLRLLRAEGMDVGDIDEDAQTVQARVSLLEEGINLHDRGLDGEKAAALQGLELFEAAVEDYPDDALIKAYYGSSVSLVGRYADDANVMFASAIKGMKILDEAVKLAPENTRVRLVRAQHSMRLPELFFRRTGVAIVDLEFVRDRYAEGAADLTKQEWCDVLWMLGNAYFRLDIVEDAQATWNVLLHEDPDGNYKDSIAAKLAPVKAVVETKAIDPNDKGALLEEGIRLHDLGVQGNKTVVAKAHELIKRAFELDKDDPVARAYFGSITALAVQDSADTSETFSQVIQAMVHLNTAVKMDPDNEVARRLRGYLCFKLPESMFHLTKTAIEDFEFLRNAYQSKSDGSAHPELSRILKHLASAYSRLGREDEAQAIIKELEGYDHGIR